MYVDGKKLEKKIEHGSITLQHLGLNEAANCGPYLQHLLTVDGETP